jgi:hypothetical protein
MHAELSHIQRSTNCSNKDLQCFKLDEYRRLKLLWAELTGATGNPSTLVLIDHAAC